VIEWRGKDEHVVQTNGPDKFMMSSECHELLLKKIANKKRKVNEGQAHQTHSSLVHDAN